MSKGPKTRGSYGPTSPRGIYSRSMAAPGTSLDMPDEKPVKKMKKGGMANSGGSYRKAADGIASKGKTKGKVIKMMKGGYCG
jgi:hypothetical protein